MECGAFCDAIMFIYKQRTKFYFSECREETKAKGSGFLKTG